jgi:hypothetical protein
MIQLKQLLCEQLGDRNAVFKQAGADRYGVVSPFNAKKIAKLIYDSKSFFNDDEVLVKNVIVKNIKNIKQYGDVNTELQKLTSGRGIGMYLQSFLNNVDRMEIVTYLLGVIPKEQWNWTIKKIMPYEDFTNIIKKNPSLWDKWSGKSPNTPISKSDLILLQMYAPEYNAKYKMSFWDNAIDIFLPGTPIKDGYSIINKFSDIIKRRIEYNKKNNLPMDKFTKEEINYRTRILNATPSYGYPSMWGFLEVIKNIKSGKNIRPDELTKYKNLYKTSTNPDVIWQPGKMNRTDQEIDQMISGRDELKKMWLGIDDPDGLNVGNYVKSEFKPSSSKDPNAIYVRPKVIPKLTKPQFNELYAMVLSTKKPDGTFPGGNSSIMWDHDFKTIQHSTKDIIRSDMGHFKLGVGIENGKKYISIYDEWDLFPPALKDKGINIQKFGTTPLIYYRIVQP